MTFMATCLSVYWGSVYARVCFSVMLHLRHADVAPSWALAAPCGTLLLWY